MRECPYCDATAEYEASLPKHIDIVFDGPPGHEAGRFVEVETDEGGSIRFGEWVKRDDGYWALRFDPRRPMAVEPEAKTDPTGILAMHDQFVKTLTE